MYAVARSEQTIATLTTQNYLKHSPNSKGKTVCPHSPYTPELSTIDGEKLRKVQRI